MRGTDVETDNSGPGYCSDISFVTENSVPSVKTIHSLRTNRTFVMTIFACFCVLGLVPSAVAKGDEVEKLIKQLNDKHANTRVYAAARLGNFKDPRAVEPLITALQDSSLGVRRSAAASLGKFKDVRAAEPLLAALKDVDRGVRFDAANAFLQLGEIEDPHAIESLIAALRYDDGHVRQKADDALVGIGAPAVEPLLVAMKDPDAIVRGNAAWTLGRIKDSRGVDVLITALIDADANVKKDAAGALVSIGPPAIEPLIAALKDTDETMRANAAGALVSIGAPAVAPLIAALMDTDVKVRAYSAAALGGIKDPSAIDPLIGTLKDSDIFVRATSASALGQMKDARAVQPLIAVLKDKEGNVRLNAALALGQIKDPRAAEPLIEALNDTDARVRGLAAWASGEIKDPRMVWPLIAALKDPDARVRTEAARSLGEIKDPRAIEPLIATFKDTETNVRKNATWGLGQIKSSDAVTHLIVALKGTDAQVQETAAAALVAIGPTAVEPLMSSLKGADSEFQKRAVAALASMGPSADEALVAALNSTDPEVRRSAADALGKAGGVLVDSKTLAFINSMGSDLVFYTSKDHPLLRLSDIKNPDAEFGVLEFSPRMMKLRESLGAGSGTGAPSRPAASDRGFGGTGVQFGAGGSVQPLGDTFMQSGGVTLAGIGEDAFGTLFQRHPLLKLFVAPRGSGGVSPIVSTGGGIRIRFVDSGDIAAPKGPAETSQPVAESTEADIAIREVRTGVYETTILNKGMQIGSIAVGNSGPTLEMACMHCGKNIVFQGDMSAFIGVVGSKDFRSRIINAAPLDYDIGRKENPPLSALGVVALNESGIVKSGVAKTGWINWESTLTFNDAGHSRTVKLRDINFWANRGGENWLSFSIGGAREIGSDGKTLGDEIPVAVIPDSTGHYGSVTIRVDNKYEFHPAIWDDQTLVFVAVKPHP
jgi:HEAT repeat protein